MFDKIIKFIKINIGKKLALEAAWPEYNRGLAAKILVVLVKRDFGDDNPWTVVH